MKRRLLLFSLLVSLTPVGHTLQDHRDPAEPLRALIERALAVRGLEGPAEVVFEHMRVVPGVATAGHRLSRIEGVLTDPWAVPELGVALRDQLAMPVAKRDFDPLVPGIASLLDLETFAELASDPGIEELEFQWRGLTDKSLAGEALLEALSTYLATAHFVLAEANAGMGEEASELLFDRALDFAEVWYRSHFPDSQPEKQLTGEEKAFLEHWSSSLMARTPIDRARTLAAAQALLRLTGNDFRRGLRKRLQDVQQDNAPHPGFEGDVVRVVGTAPEERVVLGGRRPTHYGAPAALVIDLGGDDHYARAAVVDAPDMLASVVLDLHGDDTYASDGAGPALAIGGVAILCDAGGDDRYTSKRLGQGAAVLGFALLVDVGGDDTYVLEDYGQGHAIAGVGLLYDLAGEDTYTAWAFAQGGGLAYGLAALVDGGGDDEYLADLGWPDVYGNSGPGSHHGASQGYSTGHRPGVAGGFAALLDLGKGQDRYQSGNFSQGGGYYYSFGLMYDAGGDDLNRGYRYSQGFGVHQAAGLRWDAGGDDVYQCRSVAHTGMAWDEGVGWFLDDEGDDTYEIGGLGLGGAAQTGIAIFLDGGGKDRYQGREQTQGATGGSEYHDKPSLGVMIDLGGAKDDYGSADRENGTVHTSEGVGLFLDLKEKTAKKALRSKLLRD